jgi:acetyl esterase/lipase
MASLACALTSLSLLMGALLLIRLKMPWGFYLLPLKMMAVALSPFLAVIGLIGAAIGWFYQSFWAVPVGVIGAGVMIVYVWRVTRDQNGFAAAFGAAWSQRIPPEQAKRMVQRRWTLCLRMKASPDPTWERDIAFWTIPASDRQLLCDLWSPSGGDASGLAFIFFHGGAWYMMDKDFQTRPFFRHLVAQGHTVMDVAYRLCPEVDIYGMIGDAKRAIAWMKANASRYGVNPQKIVVGGGSAGGHLALLAGYTPRLLALNPEDLKNAELSVCGVVSYYGPTDMLAEYQHTNQERLLSQDLPPVSIGPNSTLTVTPGTWRMDVLLGGWPQDALPTYQIASPSAHVHADCPPTLLLQGDLDFIAPIGATRALHSKLVESGVPAVNVVFPWTDHGFDLLLPQVNPAAQSALYEVDRFLALLLNGG